MSIIKENLYLGAQVDTLDIEQLRKLKITHIVCVENGLECSYPQELKYLHIKAHDSSEFLLSPYFDEAADYIDKATRKEGGKVLVHCKWGISLSPTIVVAYLMKYYEMSLAQAKKHVSDRRPEIFISEGFQKQLEQYEKSLAETKASEEQKEDIIEFKDDVPDATKKSKSLTKGTSTVKKDDRSGSPGEPKQQQPQAKIQYKCKSCRTTLFTDLDVIKHKPRINTSEVCTSIFIEQQDWMTKLGENENKLNCPVQKCNAKLGEAVWSGNKCSCGYWTAPAFQIHKAKVDEHKLGSVISSVGGGSK